MTGITKPFDGFDVAVDNKAKLEAKFIIPPFSVLDTRQGYWQERKRLWLSLGIESELGRVHDTAHSTMAKTSAGMAEEILQRIEQSGSGASVFDPVLCELIYKWFCPVSGHILDPFAGGSVRGIAASILGNDYTGIDLSQAQIEANRQQAGGITPDKQPEWVVGDSFGLDNLLPENKHYDLIFSCPPYHDLEQYTDDPADLSNMSWGTFREKYKSIIEKCILRLNSNRFAVFVVSEIRDERGSYKGLVPFTIQCFVQGGARYYNEMILVNVVGSLPIRIAGQFAYRKIGRTHQNVLVFYKGDIEQIPKIFKDIDTNLGFAGGNNGDL